MKIAITAENNTEESLIDQRFGRCKYFAIFESEQNDKIEFVENQGLIQGHGAGVRAAQQLAELGVGVVITGNLGPNATSILDQLNIKSYKASGKIKDAIDSFLKDQLSDIDDVVEPHSGLEVKSENDGERIYLPLLDNNGLDSRISPHFGHAPFFGLYETKTKKFKIIDNKLNHSDPNKSPVDQIIEAVNPTSVCVQGIGSRAISLFNQRGITLKTGSYRTAREAIENFDKLSTDISDCGHEHHD